MGSWEVKVWRAVLEALAQIETGGVMFTLL